MREWMKELTDLQRDYLHELEYLFGRPLKNIEEFRHICGLLPEGVKYNGYGRKEFFKCYPAMKKYREQTAGGRKNERGTKEKV